MGVRESNITTDAKIKASHAFGMALMRNSVGYDRERKVKYGFGVGSSDCIGYTPLIITADMVGRKMAIFTAIEFKTAKGRATKEQTEYVDKIKRAGGIAGYARSFEDVANIYNKYVDSPSDSV